MLLWRAGAQRRVDAIRREDRLPARRSGTRCHLVWAGRSRVITKDREIQALLSLKSALRSPRMGALGILQMVRVLVTVLTYVGRGDTGGPTGGVPRRLGGQRPRGRQGRGGLPVGGRRAGGGCGPGGLEGAKGRRGDPGDRGGERVWISLGDRGSEAGAETWGAARC